MVDSQQHELFKHFPLADFHLFKYSLWAVIPLIRILQPAVHLGLLGGSITLGRNLATAEMLLFTHIL